MVVARGLWIRVWWAGFWSGLKIVMGLVRSWECVAENLACGFVCAVIIKGVAIWLVGVASGE